MAENKQISYKRYANLFVKNRGKYIAIYNPLLPLGVSVLNKEAFYLLNLFQKKMSFSDIYKIAKKKDTKVTKQILKPVINKFQEENLIHTLEQRKKVHDTYNRLVIWIHLTNQCNLRCKYCFVKKNSKTISKSNIEKSIRTIYEYVKREKISYIQFKFSGGEPLLKFDLIVRFIRLTNIIFKNTSYDFVILTNGTLLDNSIINQIKKLKLQVAVSLDGTQKAHDKVRGRGSFDKAIKGIFKIQKLSIPFNITVTINKLNVKNLPKLTSYLLKKRIPFVYNFYRKPIDTKIDLTCNSDVLIKYIKKAYEEIESNLPKPCIMNSLLDRVYFTKAHNLPCGLGHNYIVIKPDGNFCFCHMLLDSKGGQIPSNNLNLLQKENKFIKSTKTKIKNYCQNCRWRYICAGGCPLSEIKDKRPQYCKVYKALIPEVIKLEAKRIIKYGFEDK